VCLLTKADARQEALDGRHRKAIESRWDAEGQARYNAVETRALVEVASELREKMGARKEEYRQLLNTARYYLEVGRGPSPVSPFREGMPVSTSNDVPGREITGYIGEVFGLIVRSRGALPQVGATLKAGFGGELKTMTNLLADTRKHAIDRLVDEAQARGADAVIAMRFDVTTMGQGAGVGAGWTELCAYGTAVRATKLAETPDAPGD
jgi:uncharacterized protein YbjQ (UPF0145 family)